MLFQFFYFKTSHFELNVLLVVSLQLFVNFVKSQMDFEYVKCHKNVNFSKVFTVS